MSENMSDQEGNQQDQPTTLKLNPSYWWGFCFDERGYHTEGTRCYSVEAMYRYAIQNAPAWHEIRFTDVTQDFTELQFIRGVQIFPPAAIGRAPIDVIVNARQLLDILDGSAVQEPEAPAV